MTIKIDNKITRDGFSIIVDNQAFSFSYPQNIWEKFPTNLKREFVDTAVFFSTYHLALANKTCVLNYNFPPPSQFATFMFGYYYSISATPYEFPGRKLSIQNLFKDLYNSVFRIKFQGIPYQKKADTIQSIRSNSVIMPFSFGKDSLLTFAILKKIGLNISPFYFQEPTSTREVSTKLNLKDKFEKEFAVKINTFPLQLGKLRDSGGQMWGWDLLLVQYSLLLLPYVYFGGYEYFCWSNEQSLSRSIETPNGYRINPTFDQTSFWTLNLNNMLRQFNVNTQMTSIVEPVYEMVMLRMLHTTFKNIGKYQLSCDLPEKPKHDHRWCGKCHECARQYILMLGAGIDPSTVGLKENMLKSGKINLHHFLNHFEERDGINFQFQSQPERLLAFYLAYKRGVRGGLMDLFAREFMPHIAKNAKKMLDFYLKLHSSEGIPESLKRQVLPFYEKEISEMKKDFMSNHPAPVGKF